MSKKIILTGGGTAGHVTPNIALLPYLMDGGFEVLYVGSYTGIEQKLITDLMPLYEGKLSYIGISSGKFRRYMSAKNFSDPFRVLKGFKESKKIIKAFKPDVVFSKGGFVSVPVVYAAAKYKVPTIIHESDMTPGLANKLAIKKADNICHNFPETAASLPKGKAVFSGCPIREELLSGNKNEGKKICNFTDDKPVLLVIGGSLGALHVNTAIREALPDLIKTFNVVHLCGKGKVDNSPEITATKGYVQFEYIDKELKHLFALADIVVSRAGANAICELLALKKPNLLIPLSAKASRGDQILNAKSFEKQGFSMVLEEEDLNRETLLDSINELYKNRESFIKNMSESDMMNASKTIYDLICSKLK